MRSDILNKSSNSYGGKRRKVEHVNNSRALTRTLTDDESGTLFIIDMSAVDNNVTLTLPTAAGSEGVFYEFFYSAKCDDDADFIITKNDANFNIGSFFS